MDDTVLVPEVDKAILVIRNYVEILEKKVIELGTENKDLKIENHDLHNELTMNKKKMEVLSNDKKEGFSGYYQDQPEWSGGFIKRVEKAEVESDKEALIKHWTNKRIGDL